MQEKIGGVTLNYKYYCGEDLYSDGPVEDRMLEICMAGKQQEALEVNDAWPILYHFSPIRKDILDWYPMKEDATVLEIGAGCGAITGVLSKKAKRVVCIELSQKRSMINAYQNQDCDNVEIFVGKYEDIKLDEKFDYITLIGVFEYAAYYTSAENPYTTMLEQIKDMLKPDGKLLIAIENRMGLKYLNGANEDHTGRLFDGVYNYANKTGARTFTKNELSQLLSQSGLTKYKFFYPMPDYKLPTSILSDEFEPNVGAFRAHDIAYDANRYEFFDEAVVWDTLFQDQMASYFANSLFVEAGCVEDYANVQYARYSWHRDKEYRIKTVIVNEAGRKYVVKSNLNPEGAPYIDKFLEKYELLKDCYDQITVVKPERVKEGVRFPVIEGRTIHNALLDYQYEKNTLTQKLNYYVEKVLSFKEDCLVPFKKTEAFINMFGDIMCEGVPAVKIANIDCLFENMIEKDGEIHCFDYEWTFAFPVPVFYLKFRLLAYWYAAVEHYLDFPDLGSFLLQFGLTEKQIYDSQDMEKQFTAKVLKKDSAYMGRYAKAPTWFKDYALAFDITLKEKEIVEKEKELLQTENEELQKKITRHLANEDRLRKAVKRARGE